MSMQQDSSVKQQRLARGWSKRELALRARVSFRTIRRIEEGKQVYDHVLAKVRNALREGSNGAPL